jgi:hypothetical protein
MFGFDLPTTWKLAFKDDVLPNYPRRTMASLARRIIQDVVSCFLSEQHLRERGLLAPFESPGKPDALLFAIRKWEETRREENDVGYPAPASRGVKAVRVGPVHGVIDAGEDLLEPAFCQPFGWVLHFRPEGCPALNAAH